MSDEESRDVQMCTTFANSGPLPLIFADALFAGSFLLGDVVACISFYLLVWSPLFWSFGRVILGTYGKDNHKSSSAVQRVIQEAKNILSPPVVGSILGVVVGSVPFLRTAFFGGFAAPLFGALQTLGTAYLPAAMLVLAGSLFRKKPESNEDDSVNGDKTVSTNPSWKAVVSIFISRFCFAPLLSVGIMHSLDVIGLLGPVGARPRAVVTFALLVEGCMPPAQNSVIMLQLEGLKDRASSMAKLLTLMYSMAVVPVTILMSACLATSGIMAFR
jgi:predicted permease